ncbi:MAG: zinc ABC transporter substrate-binding protein [Clostridia bacterium]|nr:zinc ABC transporter substrate-binding protein [Clostridia bacterium]
MKRIILVAVFLLLLCGCTTKVPVKESRLQVVTTVFPLYDFVRAVGGDRVQIHLLIDPGMEIHSFDPTPSDLRALTDADLFLWIGGESEKWAERFLSAQKGESLKLMDAVSLLSEEEPEQNEHHAHHEEAAEYDEHIWTAPSNAMQMVEVIGQKLAEADRANAGYYQENAARYIQQIAAVREEIFSIVRQTEDPFILVADRYPFRYFAAEFGLSHVAVFGGCAASTDLSVKTMARLIGTVEERDCKAAYYTELSNQTIAKALAEETGVQLLELHSAHNVTKADFEAGVTYVELMKRNAEALKRGFGS